MPEEVKSIFHSGNKQEFYCLIEEMDRNNAVDSKAGIHDYLENGFLTLSFAVEEHIYCMIKRTCTNQFTCIDKINFIGVLDCI